MCARKRSIVRVGKHWKAYVFYTCDILEQECGEPLERYGKNRHPNCDTCSVPRDDMQLGTDAFGSPGVAVVPERVKK